MSFRLMSLTALGLALSTTLASAETIAQSNSKWFTDAQAAIAKREAVKPNTNTAKNIILFVADGNGVGTNYATRLWMGQKSGGLGDDFVLPQERFPHLALVKTYTSNGQTPDSAPTASAMNTGVKSKNGMINIADDAKRGDCDTLEGNKLTTFGEIVEGMGKSIGIVSTARLTHATPAAVYAKTLDRNWEHAGKVPEGCDQKDIADQMLDAMKSGLLDVALGGGRRNFVQTGVEDDEGKEGRREDERNLIEEAKEAGIQYAWNDKTFTELDTAKPILGLFEASHMKYDHDRADEPSLADMTETAIKALQTNDEGFYLEVEAGRVDHANHDGNLHRVVTDGEAFAKAVETAMKMVDPAETLIIVTADHEHAIAFNGYCGRGSPITGLCYGVNKEGVEHSGKPLRALDGRPYTVAGFLNGAGSVMVQEAGQNDYSGSRPDVTDAQAMDPDYLQQALIPMTSETHSGEDVAVLAIGPYAHLFDGVIEQNEIFHIMHKAVTAK